MFKGMYIRGGTNTEFSGVDKKIKNQISVLSRYYDIHEVIIEKEKTNIIKSVVCRLPGGSWGAKYDEALREIESIRGDDSIFFFYIRISPVDRKYVSFLKTLRERYPKTRILLEVPTFPYDKEYLHSKTMWPWYFKDKYNRKNISEYIDRVVTVEDSKSLFGVPAIKIKNGLDVSQVRLISKDNEDSNSIQLIVVAMMQPYHGYERLIKGLASYYLNGGMRDIRIRMVGYGSELKFYQSLTERYNMTDRIEFVGKLEGEELDAAYEGCDIAVGSLGGYKVGITKFASIKLGEYLAKGLPVITGAPAFIFEEFGSKFNLNFPNDETEIDMKKVISFYDSLYLGKNKQDVRKEIRQFAYGSIDISLTMNNVIEYLEAENV